MKIDAVVQKEGIFSAFKNFPLFKNVPDEVLVVFFIAAQEQLVRKGQVIVNEGDNGEDLFIIGGGSVDVIKSHGQADETILATLKKNDFFGEMCVIEPILRSATVVARETTFLYSLRSSSLNKVYQVWHEQQTVIMANLSRELANRVQALDSSYIDRAF